MAITLVEGRKHNVIKRDGRIESYDEEKMRKVLKWAITHKNNMLTEQTVNKMVDEVLNDVNIRIYDKIHISKLFDEVIDTVINKISELQPIWDNVARNLLIQKYYKEVWGIKRNEYPDYLDVIKKGVSYGVYSPEIINTFSEEELKELGNYIKPERDFEFTYLGFTVFMDKYSLNYSKTKKLELPQHTFMRLAIFAFWDEDKNIRLDLIKKRYDDLSNFIYTEATPKMLNSLKDNAQIASCVLTAMEDDSWSINHTCSNIALFSKWGGGTACDVSKLRAKGSPVAKVGKSSGVIPFIKKIESEISAYDQLGKRKGACAVYFNWWHLEVEDMLMLKDEGGTEDNRARKLQYAIKLNDIFIDRVINNEDITLFDPKETPELLETFGEEFNKWYEHYENKQGIRKRKVKARDLAYLITKIRNETGNLYIFFIENANKQTPYKEFINSSNLCLEVQLPSKGSLLKKQTLKKDLDTNSLELNQEIEPGLISLCNLSSIAIPYWMSLTKKQKTEVAYNLLRASDNLIEYAFYPAKEGEISNKLYRPIGIGISSLAYWFASKGIKFTDKKAKKEMFFIMEDIAYHILEQSVNLAIERGKFEKFNESKWADGWLPIDNFIDEFNEYATENIKSRWNILRERIKKYGVRFITHFAIAPTATSSLVVPKGTEGIEPLKNLISYKTGTYSGKQLAPDLQKLRQYYQLAWEIPNETLYELAKIRQIFIDQGQSVNSYTENPDSAYDTFKDIVIANKLGLKTLYYLNMKRKDDVEVCESCSS